MHVASLLHVLGTGRFVNDERFILGKSDEKFAGLAAYAESKLVCPFLLFVASFVTITTRAQCQVVIANEMDRRFGPRGVTFVSLHPGLIDTNLVPSQYQSGKVCFSLFSLSVFFVL